MKTASCASCRAPLIEQKVKTHHYYICDKCHGHAVELKTLCMLISSVHAVKLSKLLDESTSVSAKRCVQCTKPMRRVVADNKSGTYELDGCTACKMIWFDAGEFEKAPRIPAPPNDRMQRLSDRIRDDGDFHVRRRGDALDYQEFELSLFDALFDEF